MIYTIAAIIGALFLFLALKMFSPSRQDSTRALSHQFENDYHTLLERLGEEATLDHASSQGHATLTLEFGYELRLSWPLSAGAALVATLHPALLNQPPTAKFTCSREALGRRGQREENPKIPIEHLSGARASSLSMYTSEVARARRADQAHARGAHQGLDRLRRDGRDHAA